MANTNAPFGLRPVRRLDGAAYSGQKRAYYAPASYATALFIGDPVVIVGDSNDNEFRGFPPGSLSEVNLSTGADGSIITGVIVGFDDNSRDDKVYGLASTDRLVWVCDDPNMVYEVQDDGTGALSADTVGLNASLVAGAGGSTVYGRSSYMLDGGGTIAPAVDVSQPLYILGLAKRMNNEISDYAIWDVTISQSTLRTAPTTGVS